MCNGTSLYPENAVVRLCSRESRRLSEVLRTNRVKYEAYGRVWVAVHNA